MSFGPADPSSLPVPQDEHLPVSLAPDAPPAVLTAAPTFPALVQNFRRRWLVALSLGLVGAVLAGAGAWFLYRVLVPSTYTVRTLLRVAADQPRVLFDSPEARTDFSNYQNAQVVMLKSRLVLNAALKNPEVAELDMLKDKATPAPWLAQNLKVDFLLAPEILSISLTGNSPRELAVLVNAIRDTYMKEIVNKEHNERLARLAQLKNLTKTYDNLLRTKRTSLRDMAENLGSRDSQTLNLKQQFAMSQLNTVQGEFIQLQSQLRRTQLEIAAEKKGVDGLAELPIPEIAIEEQLKQEPGVVRFTNDLAELQERLLRLKRIAVEPEKEPWYPTTLTAIERAKKALADRRVQVRPAIVDKLREIARVQAKSNLAQNQEYLAVLKNLETQLEEEVKRRNQEVFNLNRGTIDLEWLRDEIALADDVAKKAATQAQALEVESQAPPRVTLLEEALVVPTLNKNRQWMMAILASVGMFGLIALAISWWEFRARRVSCVEEVVHGLGLELVGVLPTASQRTLRNIPRAYDPSGQHGQHHLTEAVSATRALLVHTAKRESLKVVMVTSAHRGEGKTFLSTHLAANLARSGFRTLLLEGDLRRPAIHRLFRLALEPGLSEVLRGEAAVEAVVRPAQVPNLTILTAGFCNAAALQALGQQPAQALFQRLKELYDFVVVDSAPVLAVADSLLIGQQVDAVVFSILRDVSRLPSVYAACERLAKLNIRILGAVINGAPADVYGGLYPSPRLVAAAG